MTIAAFSISILFSLIVIFFITYIRGKANNLATKEDIKELTIIQEKIKTEINTISLNKRSLTEQKRKIIIDFYNQFNVIYSKLFMENSFSYITERIPLDKYNSFIENLTPELNKLMLYLSNIDLFFDEKKIDYFNENENLQSIAHSMYMEIFFINQSIDRLIREKVNFLYPIVGRNGHVYKDNKKTLQNATYELKFSISTEIDNKKSNVFNISEKFKKLVKSILFYE